MTTYICVVCGREGVAARRTRLYCSRECLTRAHARHARERASDWYATHREQVALQRQSITPEQRAAKNARRNELRRLHRYGLTPETEAAVLTSQRGVCAICRRQKRLVVDHDHQTGVVRGLLCNGCNAALGIFKDDELMLERAIEYLARPQVEVA